MRGALVVVLLGLIGMFVIAWRLDPYHAAEGPDGPREPRLSDTHTQLGLPPCSFKVLANKPCPSCGMTTSFALLAEGDVKNSLRANFVGTLLAVFCLAVVPWGMISLACGRLLYIRSLERALTWVVAFFLALLLIRWGVILALGLSTP